MHLNNSCKSNIIYIEAVRMYLLWMTLIIQDIHLLASVDYRSWCYSWIHLCCGQQPYHCVCRMWRMKNFLKTWTQMNSYAPLPPSRWWHPASAGVAVGGCATVPWHWLMEALWLASRSMLSGMSCDYLMIASYTWKLVKFIVLETLLLFPLDVMQKKFIVFRCHFSFISDFSS